ncbi:MAG TPA: serine--tRNA ligase [Terriglobales bacterium]|nr:serine--tRNA ligase [Terriglobales bacterium]
MLDLNFVRDNLALVEEKLRQRGMNPAEVLKDFRTIDAQRRQAITAAETLQAQRNRASEEIAKLKKSGQDASKQILETKVQREWIVKNEKMAAEQEARLREILTSIPNLPHASVPVSATATPSGVSAVSAVGTAKAVSTSEENVEVRRWDARKSEFVSKEDWERNPPQFDFKPKPHWELGEEMGILDLERAAKLSGARFAVYWALGARLERALANFMLDLHTREHGYTEVLPPYLVNSESMYGTGQLPKFEQDLFKVGTGVVSDQFDEDPYHTPVFGELVQVEKGALDEILEEQGERVVTYIFSVDKVDVGARTVDLSTADIAKTEVCNVPWRSLRYVRERKLWLIPTAEVPVTNLYRDEVLDGARLPVCLTAYTPCFRSEAGSYGKDVRGIIRQHQFQKVELVKFSRPETSYDELEKLTHDAETVLQKLGLHYRVVTLCTADIGFSAAKTYDLEVWLPGQNLFREISSCSNFETFQARRANIRYRPEGKSKTEFLHTLNGSGLAVGRTWVAIVENYQQADGSVRIPEALQPYMGTDCIPAQVPGKTRSA